MRQILAIERDPRRAALLVLACYLAFDLLLPLVPLPLHRPPRIVVGAMVFASTAAFMLLQLWLAQSVVNLKPPPALSAVLTLVFVAFWFAVLWYIHPHRGASLRANTPFFIWRPILLGLTITLGCAFFGILLSRIIREPNVLLPVALVAMPIDYIGAMTPVGFTQNVVAQNPRLVQALSVPVPAVGSAGHHGILHPIGFIGPGDALFMAFFFAVVLRLNLNVRGTFWWMYGLLTATMLLVLSPVGFSVAALIPMGLAVLIANGRSFKLKREEVFATIYAAALVLALVTVFYFYSHSHFFRTRAYGDNYARRSPERLTPSRPAGNR